MGTAQQNADKRTKTIETMCERLDTRAAQIDGLVAQCLAAGGQDHDPYRVRLEEMRVAIDVLRSKLHAYSQPGIAKGTWGAFQAVEVSRIIGQETREVATVPVLATLAHGTLQGLANRTILISRNGDEFSIADSCAPNRERNGAIIGAVLVFRDVTADHEGQQALRDSSVLLRTILSTATEAIITLRADDGIIDSVNPAAQRMFGHASAELLGQPIDMLVPSLHLSGRGTAGADCGTDDDPRAPGAGRDVMDQRKDGSQIPLEMALSELSLPGRDDFTCCFRDMTERRRLTLAPQAQNDQLRSAKVSADMANHAKSDFLAKMSHELRSPLNAILGFAQMMDTDEPPATAGQKANIHEILRAGWYLLELIRFELTSSAAPGSAADAPPAGERPESVGGPARGTAHTALHRRQRRESAARRTTRRPTTRSRDSERRQRSQRHPDRARHRAYGHPHGHQPVWDQTVPGIGDAADRRRALAYPGASHHCQRHDGRPRQRPRSGVLSLSDQAHHHLGIHGGT